MTFGQFGLLRELHVKRVILYRRFDRILLLGDSEPCTSNTGTTSRLALNPSGASNIRHLIEPGMQIGVVLQR